MQLDTTPCIVGGEPDCQSAPCGDAPWQCEPVGALCRPTPSVIYPGFKHCFHFSSTMYIVPTDLISTFLFHVSAFILG